MQRLHPIYLGFAILAIAGFLAVPAAPAEESGTDKKAARELVIGPDDSITIVALNCEEVSKTWRVGTSGELNLPMAGTIQAAGMTVKQFENTVAERLKKFLVNPQVTAYVSDLRSQPVTITGAVDKPGVYQIAGDKTLFEALLMAGGPKGAGPTVSLRRSTASGPIGIPGVKEYQDNGYEFVELELPDVMSAHGDKAKIGVLPNDLISVSNARPQRFVYISGEVNRPGAVELVSQDAVSLLKVLAVAGGDTPNANLKQTMIMHLNADGSQASAQTIIDLKKIKDGKAQDLSLSAGDVVVISSSGLKTTLHGAVSAAMSTGISSSILVLARI
jgi:protein involved in polysaccharide export with SLBB domain